MKRVLSLVMMAVLAIGAWAAEETIELTAAAQGYNDQQLVTSVEGDVVTLTFDQANSATAPAYYSNGDAVRLYNGGTMKVSASGKTMTKIVFVYELNGSATVSVTPATYDASTKTWTGSATEVVMTAGTAKHVRISKVTVTYEDGDFPVVTVATPVIAGETPFTESTQVSITCATEGASIYYTIDGTAPTANSLAYSAPFTLTESATVKAIAYDANNNASSVATMAFEKEGVVDNSVANAAAMNALADNTEFTFTGNLVVIAQTGKYLYAQDATGGAYIYGEGVPTYAMGDVIPAGWGGEKTTFKGAPEVQNMTNMAAATETADIVAKEITPAQVTLDNVFQYAVIKGATVSGTTISANGETVALFNRFNVNIPSDGNTYDIYGITSYFNNVQFLPLDFVAYELEVPATPVITGETPFVGSTTVTITCETEGVSIYYTIDGTEPSNQSTTYTAPFELTESATVKAYAYDATGAVSALATKEFVKKISCATVSEILALENNTTFAFTGELVVIGQAGQRLYAQDEAGDGIFFYGTAPSYEMYDVIPAGWSAKRATYKGAPELANMTDMAEATETAELTAAEMTPAEVTVDPYNLFFYAVIKGATIEDGNIVVGDNSVVIYDRFGVATPDDAEGKIYDIYGVPSWYEGAQFFPIEFVEVPQVVESTITYEAEQEGGTIAVALADGTQVESGVTKVAAGAKVTITATPDEGYKLSNIVVKCGDEVVEFDTEVTPGRAAETRTFTMPEGEVSIEATFEKETPTGIESLSMENVKSVRFYNAAGVESATPFNGVNIVVREMNDGSKSVIKVVK